MGYEVNSVMNIKDKNGNNNTIYPVTKKENVLGLPESLNELSASINSASSAVSALAGTVAGKVDKVTGKSLSTNDFTDVYKKQLDNLPSNLNSKADASDLTAAQNQLNSLNDEMASLSSTVSSKANSSDLTALAQTVGTKANSSDLNSKVDKVTGKGLSANDFDNTYKSKLENTYTKSEVDEKIATQNAATKKNAADIVANKEAIAANTADITQLKSDVESKADASTVSALSGRMGDVESEQIVLSSRMDNFTNLPDGSTAGDAELADGRVGADGKTYDNIGGAIRGQVSDLKSDLIHKVSLEITGYTWNENSYVVSSTGNIGTNSKEIYRCTNAINIKGLTGKTLILSANGMDNAGYAFYDSTERYISGAETNNGSTTEVSTFEVVVPQNAQFMRFTIGATVIDKAKIIIKTDAKDIYEQVSHKLDIDDIQETTVSTEITNFGWTDNGYIKSDNGNVVTSHKKLAYSDIIPCEVLEGVTIRIYASGTGVSGIAFYNSDTITDTSTFINGVETNNGSFTSVSAFDVVVPKGAKSFRFSSGITLKNISKVYMMVGLYDLYNTLANYTKEDIPNDNHDYLIQCFRKIGVVGDSLASGEVCSNNNNSTNHDWYEHSWLQYMARYYGFEGINFSRGGLSTTTWLTNRYGLPLAQTDGNECQCYIIGLGANDMNYDIDTHLGTSADVGTDANTFYGNYSRIIGELKAIQPKAKFFALTMSWLYTQNSTYKDYCRQINEAIRYIAENTENCYLIDLENDAFYYTADVQENMRSGHYNAIGYNMMGMHLAKIIGNYMYEHQDEFRQVEFIGTDYEWIE